MAYTSVLPVHRLDRSIDYVKDRTKTTKSAGSLEEAIDYALNREKTEETIFEDAIGCTCENAYADMVKTKERFHKKGGVQGYHLVQSFAEGEVSPELAHLIGQELAEQLLKGQFEVVITTHLNTSHYHNHLVWNSVSMVDGKKYHSNAKSYFTEVRRISDDLCRKYGLSVIQTNQGKAMHYAQWKAEAEGWSYVKKKYKLNVTNFLCSERSLTCYFYCILLDVFKILFLIFIWRQISTMTVNAHGIVKCFDVFKNQFMCMCIIKDFKPVDPFSLQKCMERFYTGVIPWICFL